MGRWCCSCCHRTAVEAFCRNKHKMPLLQWSSVLGQQALSSYSSKCPDMAEYF